MKTLLKQTKVWLLMLSVAVLYGCGGGASGDNEVTTTPTIGAKLTIGFYNADGQKITTAKATSDIIVKVRAVNDFGRGSDGVLITFASDLGSLSQTTDLTDSDGYASVRLVTTSTQLGVASVTADGTIDSKAVTISGQLEITEPDNATPAINLSLLDSSCTNPVTVVEAGSKICLKATLFNDLTPMSGEIISFATTKGTVAPQQTLTDDSGVATSFIDSDTTLLGAATITATHSDSGESISKNFEYAAPTTTSPTLALTSYEADCATPANSFQAGTTLCLVATLKQGDSPLAGEIINFALPLGTLRQTTALTDAQGIAKVLADGDTGILGAASATATYDSVSSSANYEFTANSIEPNQTPQLDLATIQSNQINNRFRAGESVKLQATIADADGNPFANTIVTFTAERGILATNSALTDNAGMAQVTLTGAEQDIGAAVATATATIEGVSYTASFNYEILPVDAVQTESAKIGYFDDVGDFIEGKIGSSAGYDSQDGLIHLDAGSTMGLNVVVVDGSGNRLTTPTPVTFSSGCAANGQANLDAQVSTVNGEARSTYEDINCATADGNEDTIVATITVNSVSLSASAQVKLSAENIGSIGFVSAVPQSIVLKGTGGQGKEEISTLTFQVKGEQGNPLAQRVVNFSLDTYVGGLKVAPMESLTNSQGLVTTRVTAGTVPTAVRVSAVTKAQNGDLISTQSDLLSVNTGLPDQNSITLSSEILNPEANNINGKTVKVNAYMADSFNNPVPDGTTINFTTEGGQIEPTCNTTNGHCVVTWTSSNPRVPNHRITVLATAIGHETFFDVNGNNVFDEADGGALSQGTDSGLDRGDYASGGFVDLTEAWRDDNENRSHDDGEVFLDFNSDGQFNPADGKFNGPQCTHATLCGTQAGNKINVRKALVMVMSGNTVRWSLLTSDLSSAQNQTLPYIGNQYVLGSNDQQANGVVVDGGISVSTSGPSPTSSGIELDEGLTLPLSLIFSDNADGYGQILPIGTEVTVTTSVGNVSGQTSLTVPNSIGTVDPNGYGGSKLQFTLINTNSTTNPNDPTQSGLITITFGFIDSSSTYTLSIPVTMLGK